MILSSPIKDLLLFEVSQRVAPFDHEVLPRSQRIALFHRQQICQFHWLAVDYVKVSVC